MARARLAHSDVPVDRSLLGDPKVRRSVRYALYRTLLKMGRIDASTIKVGRDPLDGPLADEGLPNDTTAIVRMSAMVEPLD